MGGFGSWADQRNMTLNKRLVLPSRRRGRCQSLGNSRFLLVALWGRQDVGPPVLFIKCVVRSGALQRSRGTFK